jgi:hypothetical protein
MERRYVLVGSKSFFRSLVADTLMEYSFVVWSSINRGARIQDPKTAVTGTATEPTLTTKKIVREGFTVSSVLQSSEQLARIMDDVT